MIRTDLLRPMSLSLQVSLIFKLNHSTGRAPIKDKTVRFTDLRHKVHPSFGQVALKETLPLSSPLPGSAFVKEGLAAGVPAMVGQRADVPLSNGSRSKLSKRIAGLANEDRSRSQDAGKSSLKKMLGQALGFL